MQKFLAILFITVYLSSTAFATSLKLMAFHRGTSGVTLLSNKTLYLQITPNDNFYVDTNDKGVFELSDAYREKIIRAYLANKTQGEYSVVAGCFSDFVPVGLHLVALRGIDCLDKPQ